MRSWKQAILYGVLVWALTFVGSLLLFPLKRSSQVLFDSLIPIVLTTVTVVFTNRYLGACKRAYVKEGLGLGLLWVAINWLCDLPFFSTGPMRMSFVNYMADIGLTYLLIPAITLGGGRLAARVKES